MRGSLVGHVEEERARERGDSPRNHAILQLVSIQEGMKHEYCMEEQVPGDCDRRLSGLVIGAVPGVGEHPGGAECDGIEAVEKVLATRTE